MNEETVIQILVEEGVTLVASLPCDKNKRLTSLFQEYFKVVDLTREEDGVGISAGVCLAGGKPVLSVQSSGLGNMLNALLSLTRVYQFPLPILASWRGGPEETIEAQIPFNEKLPELLDVYGIPYRIFSKGSDLKYLKDLIRKAYAENTPTVALILPSCWKPFVSSSVYYPERFLPPQNICLEGLEAPSLTRREAIASVAASIPPSSLLISNIGIPSKELYAVCDRDLNFYMLGSYTQASAIGLGCALGTDRHVYVLDGDGSLLGSSVLPVIAAENPPHLTIVALDNGTFGSTGNQLTPAYQTADLSLLAYGSGFQNVFRARSEEELQQLLPPKGSRARFVHVPILPGNSDVSNIPLSAQDIKKRVMKALLRF